MLALIIAQRSNIVKRGSDKLAHANKQKEMGSLDYHYNLL